MRPVTFMTRETYMHVIGGLHPDWDWARLMWEWHLHHVFMCRLLDVRFPRSEP